MSEARWYPDVTEIEPLDKSPNVFVRLPGSKSITNRALVLAALYGPKKGCVLEGALFSEDTQVMAAGLKELGYDVAADWPLGRVTVANPSPHTVPASDADIFVANSGTTMRFLTALVSLGHGRYRLNGTPRMHERPIEDLLVALRQLGVRGAETERHNGFPPVVIKASGLEGGSVRIRGDTSSQFLSAVMLVAPHAKKAVDISIEGQLVSAPYVDMTGRMMDDFGLSGTTSFWWTEAPIRIPSLPRVRAATYQVEPDASAASYFFGAAGITRGEVTIPNLAAYSPQGDLGFLRALEEMGCAVRWLDAAIMVKGDTLRGIDVDMRDISDTVMTLAAVACFAEGPTTIRNVAHIRHKETDRLTALATELRRLGAEVDEFADGLRITPRPLHGTEVETYNDHRMAMSLALIGLKVPGVVIKNPGCVAKTYPGFWDDLEKLRA